MGRQVNILLTPEDTVECLNRIQQRGPIIVFRRKSPDNQPDIINQDQIPDLHEVDYGLCLTLPEHLGRVKFDYVPAQEYFYVNVDRSLAMEFGQCKANGRVLKRGRLYYVPSYLENGISVEKSPEFVQWSEWVLRAAVKGLNRDPEFGFHIGPHAERLYNEGKIELSQM